MSDADANGGARTVARGLKAPGLLLTSALLLTCAFPPLDRGELAWIALVPWLLFLRGRSTRAAFFGSYAVGLLHYGVSLSWVAMMTPAGLIGLVLYLSVYPGVAGVLLRRVFDRGVLFELFAVASVWCALEYLRSILFSGFPWLLVGHSQYRFSAVTQVADLGGVFLVGFLVALGNAALSRAVVDMRRAGASDAARWWRAIAAAAIVLALALGYGAIRLAAPPDEPGPNIAGVQANIAAAFKHEASSEEEILREHYLLSRAAVDRDGEIDLVVWSETMFPEVWDEDYAGVAGMFRDLVGRFDFGTSFLTGITAISGDVEDPQGSDFRQWNRALLFDSRGELTGHYDKIHRVPVGEYFPLRSLIPFRRSIERAFFELAGWYPTLREGERSPVLELSTDGGVIPFGVLICYDSVFSDVALRSAREGARFLLNISNDGWYRESAELDQILAITTFRAIESRLPVFRVTNSGISAVVDSKGRIVERLVGTKRDGSRGEKEARGVLVRRVGLGRGSSPYSSASDLFAWVTCAGALVAVITPRKRRRDDA